MTVSELQARVSANTTEAERAFQQLEKAQRELIDSSRELSAAVTATGEKIDEASTKGVAGFSKLNGVMSQFSQKMTQMGLALSIGVTAPIIKVGDEALKVAVRFDSLDRGLSSVMHGSANARAEFKKLQEVAKLPGLGLEEAEQGSINLQAAGASAETARKALMGFGNALATVGKGKADLEGVNLALSQMLTTGKVLGQDLNQLRQRVPQIGQIMLKVFGTADTEILQKAKITSAEFIEAVTSELLKLPKITGGIQNDMENLSDTWKLTLREMGIALFPFVKSVSDFLVPIMLKVTESLKAMSPAQKSLLVWAVLAIAAIGPLVLGLGLLAGAVVSLTEAFELLAPVGLAIGETMGAMLLPFTLIAAAVAGLYLAWKYNWGGMRDTLNSVFSSMKEAFSRWTKYAIDTWKEWTKATHDVIVRWGPQIQDFLMRFKVFWETFWTGIAMIITSVFGIIRLAIDAALGAIRTLITAILKIMAGDWAGAWQSIQHNAKETWTQIQADAKDSLTNLQGQWQSYFRNVNQIVKDGNKNVQLAAAQNPLIKTVPTTNGMMVSHASTGMALPTLSDSDIKKHSGGVPGALPPAVDVGLKGIRDRVAAAMNAPKKTKMTDEQRQELSLTKELRDAHAELNALRSGANKEMADELGKYNLLNPAKVAELGIIKMQIKAETDRIAARKKSQADLLDEQKRFHDAVKGTEAAIRDMRSGGKDNAIGAEFPHAQKGMIEYFSSLKDNLQHLKDVKRENDNFKQSLAEVQGQIDSLISGNGLAALKAQFKGLVPDVELQKLNDANAQLKSLQELKNALDKVALLQMPSKDREAATALGLDMWKSMTDEARKNTLAIFANKHAQDELAKSLEKANALVEKRAATLVDFSASMEGRLRAANANALGDTKQGAWEKLLSSNDSLRDALGAGPTEAKAEAMKKFFAVFDAEESAKRILDTSNALEKFNSQMDDSIKLSQLRLQGRGDTAEAKWQEFLLSNKNLSDKFKNDTEASTEAFQKFKRELNLSRESADFMQFESNIAELQKQLNVMTATDPFDRFKKSMMEVRDGKLIQPFSEDQLKEMFQYNQILDLATQLQDVFMNAFSSLKDGFGAFFQSIVSGFEKMIQQMAAKWLTSQLVNLVVNLIGNAIGGAATKGSIPGRAIGGAVQGGQAYMVGERGPELFVPNESGHINNNPQGGNTNIVNFHINTPDANSFKQSQGQIMTDAKRQLDYQDAKNNSRYARSR